MAAEPKEYADKEVRTRNSTTTRKAEQIIIDEISTNINASDSTSGILKLKYDNPPKIAGRHTVIRI